MSIFICEKCGKIDNTACNNNYWHAAGNKYKESKNEPIDTSFKPEYAYFETHVCCSDCCDGLVYKDNSGVIRKTRFDIENKDHWSKFGKDKLLELEARKDGSMINATEYLKSIGELQ